jgi:DNA-nicking Smr family endonuclease
VSRKRDIRDEERALWDEVTRDVRRLRAQKAAKAAKSAAEKKRHKDTAPALSSAVVAVRAPAKPAARMPSGFGIDGSTATKLKRGKIEPEAKLDLHGMTQAQAHDRLASFLRRAFEHEFRCVLVVTGKGAPAAREPAGFALHERSKAGVLRTMVPRWLEEAGLRPLIVGVQAAHQRHGGEGALYVYLRRQRVR